MFVKIWEWQHLKNPSVVKIYKERGYFKRVLDFLRFLFNWSSPTMYVMFLNYENDDTSGVERRVANSPHLTLNITWFLTYLQLRIHNTSYLFWKMWPERIQDIQYIYCDNDDTYCKLHIIWNVLNEIMISAEPRTVQLAGWWLLLVVSCCWTFDCCPAPPHSTIMRAGEQQQQQPASTSPHIADQWHQYWQYYNLQQCWVMVQHKMCWKTPVHSDVVMVVEVFD